MARQYDDSLTETNLLRCSIHHPSGPEALHPAIYDTSLLLEREKQNLLRMQTARDLMDQINVHTRPQERYTFHPAAVIDKDALCQTVRLETHERQRALQRLDEQISYHANTKLQEYSRQKGHRRGISSPPVYSWLIPELCRDKSRSIPLNKSSGPPLLVHGVAIDPRSGLLE